MFRFDKTLSYIKVLINSFFCFLAEITAFSRIVKLTIRICYATTKIMFIYLFFMFSTIRKPFMVTGTVL